LKGIVTAGIFAGAPYFSSLASQRLSRDNSAVLVDVRGIMERAFLLSQTAASPDPFLYDLYDLQYYGYSK
jgi:hypothetical protein